MGAHAHFNIYHLISMRALNKTAVKHNAPSVSASHPIFRLQLYPCSFSRRDPPASRGQSRARTRELAFKQLKYIVIRVQAILSQPRRLHPSRVANGDDLPLSRVELPPPQVSPSDAMCRVSSRWARASPFRWRMFRKSSYRTSEPGTKLVRNHPAEALHCAHIQVGVNVDKR